MLNKIRHPILFQGNLNKRNYFEGWYYKFVSANQKINLSFIPAISLNKNDLHSFIQYILVETNDIGMEQVYTGYVRYPISKFTFTKNPFSVTIGSSTFSENKVSIYLEDEAFQFDGTLILGELHPIQTSILQPNIMGFFGYIPYMECYHGVISMKHSLQGQLNINGKKVDFTDGRGYIEKDWGSSFPKKYIWLQSNHFENPTVSLFFSVANIPFYFVEFQGFICNLLVDDNEYRFATYNHSQCSIEQVNDRFVHIRVKNKTAELEIKAEVLNQGRLIAPVKGSMIKSIKEGISGIVSIQLKDKRRGKVFTDIGKNAGVEIVGYHE